MAFHAHVDDDARTIAAPTANGFIVFQCEPWKLLGKVSLGGTVAAVVPLSESLVAVWGSSRADSALSSRSCCIYAHNQAKNSYDCVWQVFLTYGIRNLVGSRSSGLFAIVCDSCTVVYALSDFRLIDTVLTDKNTFGICALNGPAGFLALPAKSGRKEIHVRMYKGSNLLVTGGSNVSDFSIHLVDSCERIELSSCGNFLAIAADDGTLIYLYSMSTCSLITTYRRGRTLQAITSMKFFAMATPSHPIDTPDDSTLLISAEWQPLNLMHSDDLIPPPSFLCVSSSSSTVHIFQVPDGPPLPVLTSGSMPRLPDFPLPAVASEPTDFELVDSITKMPVAEPSGFMEALTTAATAASGSSVASVARVLAGIPSFAVAKEPQVADVPLHGSISACCIVPALVRYTPGSAFEFDVHDTGEDLLDVVSQSLQERMPLTISPQPPSHPAPGAGANTIEYHVLWAASDGSVFVARLNPYYGGNCTVLDRYTLQVQDI
jgi:hypothetical protein